MQISELLGIATIIVIAISTLAFALILFDPYGAVLMAMVLTVVVVINVRNWMTKSSRRPPA